jgi:hypothetical protein
MRTVIRFTVVAVVAAALGGACSSSSSAKKDVSITACTPGPNNGHPTATGTIANHTSKASLYTIHVQFTDPSGNKVGDGIAAVAKVGSGATAKWHANGTEAVKGSVKCSLSQVTRTESP